MATEAPVTHTEARFDATLVPVPRERSTRGSELATNAARPPVASPLALPACGVLLIEALPSRERRRMHVAGVTAYRASSAAQNWLNSGSLRSEIAQNDIPSRTQ